MTTEALVISDEDRATLESWKGSRSIRASHVERARTVLAVADGKGTSGTAREIGVSRPTVIKWRDRYAEHGWRGWMTSRAMVACSRGGRETFKFSTDPQFRSG